MSKLITESLRAQDLPDSCLYIISTPIGNMADITFRAAYVLEQVDGIACEDTRHTHHLLNYLGIQKPLMAIHDHNEVVASQKLLGLVSLGQRWAYVSDAGTPGISDPGAKLVNTFIQAGIRVIPIPGVSAVSTALSVSGITTIYSEGRFQFLGFLPTKGRERKTLLQKLYTSQLASVFFESPQRIKETLTEIGTALKNETRTILVGRELTKKFETLHYVLANQMLDWIREEPILKGEFCIIVEGFKTTTDSSLSSQEVTVNSHNLINLLSPHLGSKQIAEVLSQSGVLSKNQAYQLALELKDSDLKEDFQGLKK
jgi:16S rRNA (cytidine1402-2'-O)-methyltransferase